MELNKTLEIVNDNTYTTMLRLQFREGGNVPEAYSGLYKSRSVAKRAIEQYKRELEEKKHYPSAPKTAEEKAKPRATKDPAPKAEKKEEVKNDGEAKDIS
jgi:hypothetical protein